MDEVYLYRKNKFRWYVYSESVNLYGYRKLSYAGIIKWHTSQNKLVFIPAIQSLSFRLETIRKICYYMEEINKKMSAI